MCKPKARHPGSYYHVVRRIHRREFRLRPDKNLNAAIVCLIQDACDKTGVQVLAICVMSNHVHIVLYDPEGGVSAWMSHIFGTIARFVNFAHRTDSHVWDAQEIKDFRLGDMEAVARAVAYVVCNPVAAGLVRKPVAWPGICTVLKEVGSGEGPVYARPEVFFRDTGPVSKKAMLRHEAPPGLDAEEFRAMVDEHLAPMLATAQSDVKRRGGRYLGARAVEALHPFRSPRTESTPNVGADARTVPTEVASSEATLKAMAKEKANFVKEYIAARALLRDPERKSRRQKVIFPAGTWRQWQFYGVERLPLPPQDFTVP